jgi:excisionase family DNA binding protein
MADSGPLDIFRLANEAPPSELPALLGVLAQAQAVALARLTQPHPVVASPPDENVSVEEAARRLGVSDRWLYKNADHLPFVRRIGRRVLCSARALSEWNGRQRR